MKKLTLLTVTLLLTALVQLTAQRVQAEVSIPDENLANAIRETLGLPTDAVITADAMLELTELYAAFKGITALTGLEHAVNLIWLNLKANAVSDVSPLANLTQLEWLDLSHTAISDVSPLSGLTQLTSLALWVTAVSDVSPLSGLTQLTSLWLIDTAVSDVSPLSGLTQLTSLWLTDTAVSDVSPLANLTQLEWLWLQDCPLNADAYQTHIPAIQANGTKVVFDPLKPIHLQRVPWLVSLIYFRPSDRPVRPNVDAEIDGLIKKAQRFFADQLELHGFGRKTFQFETDAHGNAVVHHVNGKFPNAHYQENRYSWRDELLELWLKIDHINSPARSIFVHMLDSAPDGIGFTGSAGSAGRGFSANIDSWDWVTLAHELAHVFYLAHDWRTDANAKRIKTFTDDPMLTSFCAAEWLSVHPAFNPGQPVSTSVTIKKMLPPTLASPPNTIRLRFEVTDPDGLHQAQLEIADFVVHSYSGQSHIVDCKPLNGHDNTVEFLTTALTPQIEEVTLKVIDVRGDVSSSSFPIDVSSLTEAAPQLVVDVNGDGIVNIQDLVLVAGQFGETGKNSADVNGDGVVNIQDLVLVAGAFGEGAAAPSARAVSRARLTASDVEGWLVEARVSIRSGSGDPELQRGRVGQDRPILTSFSPQTHLLSGSGSGDPELQRGRASRPGGLSYLRGIAVLEQLLASLMPKETALLANYPNPFNPETWIPYQLSEPAEVTVTIYAANGAVVRTLDLGHQRAGSYASRSRAAYWDGRNAQGEPVASGVYFYTLQAGDFTATRKMVIRK